MTFIGVYFITSNRKADSGKLALETTEWAMASQSQFVPSHHHRTSLDSYTAGRALYPSEQTRTESFMEQGRVPPQSIGYVIPQPRSGRPTRNSIAAEAIGPNTPLMGTSSRQSIAGSKDQIANLTNALAGSHHTTLLLGNSRRYHLRDEFVFTSVNLDLLTFFSFSFSSSSCHYG